MRILAISYLFPNRVYPNLGIFVLNRLQAVSEHCEVKVINPIPSFPLASRLERYKDYDRIPEKETLGGIEVFHPRFFIIPRFFKFLDTLTFSRAVVPLALRLRQRYPFDLIDLHWTYPDLLSGRVLARATGLNQVVTVRGKEALHPGEHNLRKKILDRLLPQSDCVITLSAELKAMCVAIGVPEQRIAVVRNGVDTQRFHPMDKKKCREKLGLPDVYPIILSVGSLVYGKGFDRILRALPSVIDKYPDARLYLVGSAGPAGDYRNALHKLIASLEIENRVHLAGEVSNEQLPYWYNAADLFCLASRSEGSPNALNEALACGCPTVATATGSVMETLKERSMGRVVPNDDGFLGQDLQDVVNQEFDRSEISRQMSQYSWQWCGRQVFNCYCKALGMS